MQSFINMTILLEFFEHFVLQEHIEECPFVDINCPKECGQQLQRKDLQQHLEKDCPLRTILCKYCKTDVRWDAMEVCLYCVWKREKIIILSHSKFGREVVFTPLDSKSDGHVIAHGHVISRNNHTMLRKQVITVMYIDLLAALWYTIRYATTLWRATNNKNLPLPMCFASCSVMVGAQGTLYDSHLQAS